ncbi:SIS domain-containing protein [Bacillus sp. IITD106]|nr:SIS domain-containing protein [Bacillus sp. IITD106]
MTKPTMLDYIHETKPAVIGIIQNSGSLCGEFAKQVANKGYKRIILAASGTSYNACVTAKYFMEKMFSLPVTPMTAYSFAHYENVLSKDDLIVAVTQEGESTNTIDCLKKANELGLDNYVVTEYLDNTCTQIAKGKVTIDCGREFVGPKTKGYTATVLTLYMMALESAQHLGTISQEEYVDYKERAAATINNLDVIVEQTKEWFEANKEDLINCERCYMLGYGANVGTAIEGALKSLETVRDTFFGFEVEEFLHGPLASVKPDVYTILIAPKGFGYDRATELYKILHSQNEHSYAIGAQESVDSKHVLAGDFINDPDFSTLEYCVPLQLFAYLLYTAKGIDLEVRNYPRTRDALPTKANPVRP